MGKAKTVVYLLIRYFDFLLFGQRTCGELVHLLIEEEDCVLMFYEQCWFMTFHFIMRLLIEYVERCVIPASGSMNCDFQFLFNKIWKPFLKYNIASDGENNPCHN